MYVCISQKEVTMPPPKFRGVRSLRAGVQPTLDPSAETYSGPARLPRERKGISWCVLATCRVKEGLSRSEQLVEYFFSAPLLDVAYYLA